MKGHYGKAALLAFIGLCLILSIQTAEGRSNLFYSIHSELKYEKSTKFAISAAQCIAASKSKINVF